MNFDTDMQHQDTLDTDRGTLRELHTNPLTIARNLEGSANAMQDPTPARTLTREAGLDFDVVLRPTGAFMETAEGTLPSVVPTGGFATVALAQSQRYDGNSQPMARAIVRDTVLGDGFKSGYTVYSNDELANLCDDMVRQGWIGQPISATSWRGHRVFLLTFHAGTFDVATPSGTYDRINREVIAGVSHDGTTGVFFMDNATRPFCDNQFGYGMPNLGRKVANVKHTRNLAEYIDTAKAAVEASIKRGKAFERHAQALADRATSTWDAERFFVALYSRAVSRAPMGPNDSTEARQDLDRYLAKRERYLAKRERILDGWRNTYAAESAKFGDCAWVAFNAVTYWVDHERTTRRASTASSTDALRAFGAVLGSGADLKRKVLDLALEFFGVQA